MSPRLLLAIQFTFSVILFGLIAKWYVAPLLRRLPVATGLVPLFLVHALRYLPSTAFAPGQVDPHLPMDAMAEIAYGDLISALLALVAALFLRYRLPGALAVAWAVNIIASIDWLNAGYLASSRHFADYALGGNWYIINYYVPLIGVIHVLIFARLLQGSRQTAQTKGRLA